MNPPRPSARRLVVVTIATTLIAGMLLAMGPGVGAATDTDRRGMKRVTNRSRLEHEVRRVYLRERLSELARRHSVRMARRGELFHTPNAAAYYLDGIAWSAWGENVGYTSGTRRHLQRLFMRSPGHRANILNRRFRHVAIGTVRRNGVLWVTVFFYG